MGAGGVYTLVSFRKEQAWQRPLLPLQPTLPRRLALDGSLADMMDKVASPPAFLSIPLYPCWIWNGRSHEGAWSYSPWRKEL